MAFQDALITRTREPFILQLSQLVGSCHSINCLFGQQCIKIKSAFLHIHSNAHPHGSPANANESRLSWDILHLEVRLYLCLSKLDMSVHKVSPGFSLWLFVFLTSHPHLSHPAPAEPWSLPENAITSALSCSCVLPAVSDHLPMNVPRHH